MQGQNGRCGRWEQLTRGTGTNALGVVPLLEHAVDMANRELQSLKQAWADQEIDLPALLLATLPPIAPYFLCFPD